MEVSVGGYFTPMSYPERLKFLCNSELGKMYGIEQENPNSAEALAVSRLQDVEEEYWIADIEAEDDDPASLEELDEWLRSKGYKED